MVANSDTGQAIQARHYCIPHIFVWGSCFWFCTTRRRLFILLSSSAAPSSHTIFHTTLSHIIFHTHTPSFAHTLLSQLCHPPSFTHNFVTHPSFTLNFVTHTHHLSHSTLSHTHTIFYQQLCHTPHLSHTTLSHTIFHTHNFVTHHLSHTTLSHTIFHTQLCPTPSWHGFWRPLVALGWLGWHAWSPLVARGAAPLCVAGVALRNTHLRFTWQAWHLETSTCVWRGRRGTSWHPPSFNLAHLETSICV